jgi:hypothetical protein
LQHPVLFVAAAVGRRPSLTVIAKPIVVFVFPAWLCTAKPLEILMMCGLWRHELLRLQDANVRFAPA